MPPNRKPITILLFVLACCTQLDAQQVLVLENNRAKRVRFYPGSVLDLKVHKNGMIAEMSGTLLRTDKQFVYLDEAGAIHQDSIVALRKGNQRGKVIFRTLFRSAGRAYFGISTFNRLINNDQPVVHKSAIMMLAAGETAGMILELIRRRWYKEGRRWNIRIIDLSPM